MTDSPDRSWRLAVMTMLSHRFAKPWLLRTPEPHDAKRDFERAALLVPAPPYVSLLSDPDGLHWVQTGQPTSDGVLLYTHGGGYISGSPWTHRGLLGRLSLLTGMRVAAPDYPLAPDHPAPAAFEAARAAHARLLELGYAPGSIVLGGDSAGGGLALALLAELTQRGLAPAGLFAFSPWTDLTLSGESLKENADKDRLLPVARIEELVGFVASSIAPSDPRVSPLFAEFRDPPPVYLQVSETEILRDDARRMADLLRATGGDVRLDELQDAPHVFQILDAMVPEALEAVEKTARFVREIMQMPEPEAES